MHVLLIKVFYIFLVDQRSGSCRWTTQLRTCSLTRAHIVTVTGSGRTTSIKYESIAFPSFHLGTPHVALVHKHCAHAREKIVERRDGHTRLMREALSGHQWSSGLIRAHQGSSGHIEDHQGSSGIIKGHQGSSGVISRRDGHTRLWIQSVRQTVARDRPHAQVRLELRPERLRQCIGSGLRHVQSGPHHLCRL